jgi:hypothetical protein
MSSMKRVLEVIEADEELNAVYVHLLKTHSAVSDEYTQMMDWLIEEARDVLAESEN